jgi:hypothetical protein
MPRVDFVPDVDGFAFKNDWTFDERERQEIRAITQAALPVAVAALTPIVMAASPMIAPVAGLALGPVLPLIALAGPFLFAAAPKISELVVNAIVDAIAKGKLEGNLCGGMTAAALDNTPTVVLWKAVASVFGDWGRDWLRDRTREELAKIDAGLASDIAVPIGIVWKSNDMGHIVVRYGLEWLSPDRCSLTVYDNERPDQITIFDIDLTPTPIRIVDRKDNNRSCDGVFLGAFRQKVPMPVIAMARALSVSPTSYVVQGEPVDGTFELRNSSYEDLIDGSGALRSAGQVVADAAGWVASACWWKARRWN